MPETVKDVTTAEWQAAVLGSTKPVAVDFWHEQCIWCKRLEPDYASVAAEKSSKMTFYKLHVFREAETARRYGVQGTPTIKFFCGGREIHEIVGYRPKAALSREIDMVLGNYADCLKSSSPVGGG
ncbi:MAG TPA: thioredoxin fold domain-containing protein [Thermoplasmata archaeon]|nr:thioredoxin fold domain-containing protein [Thermoplasmata archaeon]